MNLFIQVNIYGITCNMYKEGIWTNDSIYLFKFFLSLVNILFVIVSYTNKMFRTFWKKCFFLTFGF